MTRHARWFATAIAIAVASWALVACSGGSPATAPTTAGALSDVVGAATSSSSSSGRTIDLAKLDMCSLLTPADANDVARAQRLSGTQTAATTYTLKTEKENSVGQGCRFFFSSDGTSFGAYVTIIAQPAGSFTVFSTSKRITGLGDEAYSDNGSAPVVRVGNIKVIVGDLSLTSSFATAMLYKIVPKIK